MTDNIAVVKPYYLLEEAYQMGHDRTAHLDLPEGEEIRTEHFTDTAEYANSVLPTLRAMAGYDDHGYGTYTDDRQVAAILPGCEEDEPAEAELMEAYQVHDELVEAFLTGYLDGAHDTWDPDSVQHWA